MSVQYGSNTHYLNIVQQSNEIFSNDNINDKEYTQQRNNLQSNQTTLSSLHSMLFADENKTIFTSLPTNSILYRKHP